MTYRTSLPLHETEDDKPKKEKKRLRLARKVRDAWNAQPDSSTVSKEAKKFKRKLTKYKKKTGRTDWYNI